MPITISLWSTKQDEVVRFLSKFYQKKFKEDITNSWIGEFFNPLDSVDIISALMDNIHSYDIAMYIHMENGYLHKITEDNYNEVIKDLFEIYYLAV